MSAPVGNSNPASRFNIGSYLSIHAQMALGSLGRLLRQPVGNLMTIALIGIALALPAGLYLLVGGFESLSQGWEGRSSLSVFLRLDAPEGAAGKLALKFNSLPEVEQTRSISAKEALDEFRSQSGFSELAELIADNPLPQVVLVKPRPHHNSDAAIQLLADRLKKEPLVEHVQLDLEWVKRLQVISQVAKRIITILACVLTIAVMLMIGNTIRIEVQSRHQEIEIIKLVGGSNAFIRRPFLYTGLWFGLLGGLFAIVLIIAAGFALQGPILQLSELYGSTLRLPLLNLPILALLLLGSPLLGLIGTAFSVGRQLKAIEPS